jgi:alkylation response protein AidB-like acyl-CoA dehydrogenase
MSIPEEYGGLGLSVVEEVAAAFVLGKASPAFRSLIGTNNGIGSQGIIIDGTPEQKTRYLPKLASGEMIASFALTEPGAGSDAASLRTSARRDGDQFVLNGTKRYITNAPHAGLFTVFARTDPSSKNESGVTAFFVEAAVPGICLGAVDKKMGHKGRRGVLQDVRQRNGRPDSGPRGADLRWGRLHGGLRHREVLSRRAAVPHLRRHDTNPADHYRAKHDLRGFGLI